jgi:hypothetical protein
MAIAFEFRDQVSLLVNPQSLVKDVCLGGLEGGFGGLSGRVLADMQFSRSSLRESSVFPSQSSVVIASAGLENPSQHRASGQF